MALEAGSQLGPYEIQSAEAAGGAGDVYQARDTRLDRTVAIKVLPSDWSGHPGLKQRLEAEAKIIAGLQHPHIRVLHDVGRERPQLPAGQPQPAKGEPSADALASTEVSEVDFLVLEHLEGETVADRLAWATGATGSKGKKGRAFRVDEALWSAEATNRALFVGTLGSKDRTRVMAAETNVAYAAPGYLVVHREATVFAQSFDAKKLAFTGDAVQIAGGVGYDPASGRGSFDVSQNDQLLYFQGDAAGAGPVGRGQTAPKMQLGWVSRTGQPLARAGDPASQGDFDVSPDGKLIAVTRQDGTGADIWAAGPGAGPQTDTADWQLAWVDRTDQQIAAVGPPGPYRGIAVGTGATLALGPDPTFGLVAALNWSAGLKK